MRAQIDSLKQKLTWYYTQKYNTQKWLTLLLLSMKGFIVKPPKTALIVSYTGALLSGILLLVNNIELRREDKLITEEEKQNRTSACLPRIQKSLLYIENGAVLGIIAEISRRFFYSIDFDETDQNLQIGSLIMAGVLSLRAVLSIYEVDSKKSLAKKDKLILGSGSCLIFAEVAMIFSRVFLNQDYNYCNTINIGLTALNTIISRIVSWRLICQQTLEEQRYAAQHSVQDNLSFAASDLAAPFLTNQEDDVDIEDEDAQPGSPSSRSQSLSVMSVDPNSTITEPTLVVTTTGVQFMIYPHRVINNNEGASTSLRVNHST